MAGGEDTAGRRLTAAGAVLVQKLELDLQRIKKCQMEMGGMEIFRWRECRVVGWRLIAVTSPLDGWHCSPRG